MSKGGKRTGAGRKVGSKSKKTIELLEAVESTGVTPLQFILSTMRDPNQPIEIRIDAAKSAAPYVHSKMPTAIVTPPPPGGPVSKDDETIIDRYLTGLHDEADEG